MGIKIIKGNIFNTLAEVIVNPVNCVGYMGKGLALEFRLLYPKDNERYMEICSENLLKPGKLFITRREEQRILHFPTKNHYAHPSRMEYIEEGLKKFVSVYRSRGIRSIAFPQLGVGLGGLKWEEVKKLMVRYLGELEGLDVEIYEYEPGEVNFRVGELRRRLDILDRKTIMGECGLTSRKYDDLRREIARVRSISDLLLVRGIGEKSVVRIVEFLKKEEPVVSHIQRSMELY